MRLRRSSGPKPMHPELTKVDDSHPKDGLFAQPLVISSLKGRAEEFEGGQRAVFTAVLKDAEGRRCPDIAMEAAITGPERTATGEAVTDMMGTIRFRMAGPPGTYRLAITDVAGGALTHDPDAGAVAAEVTLEA